MGPCVAALVPVNIRSREFMGMQLLNSTARRKKRRGLPQVPDWLQRTVDGLPAARQDLLVVCVDPLLHLCRA